MRVGTLIAVLGGMMGCAAPAAATMTVNIVQSGSDVVTTSSGTLNVDGLTNDDEFFFNRGVYGQAGYAATGAGSGDSVIGYFGFTGAGSFGDGEYMEATSGTGDNFAVNGSGFGEPYVFVPVGFVSGSALAGTALFANTTIQALGLTPGTYNFTLPNDTITVNIAGAVPEPATWGMMIVGFGAIGGTMRRRKTTVRFA